MKQLTTTLTLLALCAACGGLEDDPTAAASSEASFTALSASDQFIREYGLDDDLCVATKTGVKCISQDRRTPLSVGDTPTGDFAWCSETQRGRLACEDEPQAFICGIGVCMCFDYSDCWSLAVAMNCNVQVLPCAGCPTVTGVCLPGH